MMTTENKPTENRRNTIYEGLMYREDVKNKFLSSYPEDTQKTYKRIFLKSYMLESMWDKDLCDFNQEELEQLLASLAPLTIGASKTNLSTLNSYINWCIPNYTSRQTNVSPLEFLKSNKEFITKFVDESIKLYISKQELDEIGSQIVNGQDSAIIYSLFNGLSTQQLQYMKKEDIDFKNNTVVLRNEDETFVLDHETGEVFALEVDPDCINHLRRAIDDDLYHFKNGEPNEKAHMNSIELVENEYVIRVGKTRNKAPLDPAAYHVISQRVKMIAELMDNPQLTPKNITKSGHIYEGYKLWVEAGKPDYTDGKLTTEMYHAILKKFNYPKSNNGSYNTNSLRQYVTIEVIKSLYGD